MDQSRLSAVPMKSLEPESDEEDEEIDEMLEKLKEHLKECQKMGKYVEAQMAQNRVAELKEKKSVTRLEKIKRAQEKELKALQDANEEEEKTAVQKWEEELAALDKKFADAEEALTQKQEEEAAKCRQSCEEKIPEKLHLTEELVGLRKMEEALAKQGKYLNSITKKYRFEEAHGIKMEIMKKEKEEQAAWLEEREKKIQKKLETLNVRHMNEIQALQKTHEKERIIKEKEMNNALDLYHAKSYAFYSIRKKLRNAKTHMESDNQAMLKKFELQNSKFISIQSYRNKRDYS